MKEDYKLIPIVKIRKSNTNPRKTLVEDQEKELAENIKARGIDQPILVRPANDGEFQLVDGERRWRAAATAGLAEVPAFVRELSDEQVVEIQLVSFTQKVDIHPLDEAAAYEQLRKKKFDIAQISAKVGKDRSYIAKRLRLATLIEPAKKQLRDGRITLGHAIEIARLHQEVQKEALREISYGVGTVAELREYIQDELMADLKSAPFKKDDATLVPKAGPCTICPKRTGANLDLFDDVSKKTDHCLDRKCYDLKIEAFVEIEKSKAPQEGEGGESGSKGKAPVSMARRQELYKRRLEIFENRIDQEARLRQSKSLLLRLKWPADRKDFELIACRLLQHGNFDEERVEQILGLKEGDLPDVGYRDEPDLKPLSKLSDQRLVQLVFAIILDEELITDPLMHIPEETRLDSICPRHSVDRKKIRDEVAKEMAPKKPKPPKIEPDAKPKKPAKKKSPKAGKKGKK